MERREGLYRLAFGDEGVRGFVLVGVAQRHAADDHLRIRNPELVPDDIRVIGDGGLGAESTGQRSRSPGDR